MVLGTPLGRKAFVEAHDEERMRRERMLLERLQDMPDLQCQWAVLSQSAVPRANHTLRILPPSLSKRYAEQHDEALWQTFCELMGAQAFSGDVLG